MSDQEKRDPPIEAPGFIAGVNVVDIGDIRVKRGLTRRPYSSCRHRRLFYDNRERRIWCQDCERDVDPFDAFENIVGQFGTAHAALTRQAKQLEEVETFKMRSLAAKRLDEEWRRHNSVPACPHCGAGLFPEDFKHGCATLGKEFAQAMADRRKGKKA